MKLSETQKDLLGTMADVHGGELSLYQISCRMVKSLRQTTIDKLTRDGLMQRNLSNGNFFITDSGRKALGKKDHRMDKRKRGCIEVDMQILRQTPIELKGKILSGFVVWRVESQFDTDTVIYFGEHPDFDLIGEGEITPKYTLEFDGNGKSTYTRQAAADAAVLLAAT